MVHAPIIAGYLGGGLLLLGLSIFFWRILFRPPGAFRPTRLYVVGIVCAIVGLILFAKFSDYRVVPPGSLVLSEAPSLTTKPLVLPAGEFLAKGDEYSVEVRVTLRVTDPEALLKAQKPGELKEGLRTFLGKRIEEQLNLGGAGLQVVKVYR